MVPRSGERAPVHDRGKVLVHALLMLAGGEACSDIEHLRAQPVLFGEVASDSTLVEVPSENKNDGVTAAIGHNRFDRDTWQPALAADGDPSERAQVADLTDSVDLSAWPQRTRFIARREPLHPGAQRTLFDSEVWRYRGLCTDAEGDPAELDAHMRAHARIENTIADLKIGILLSVWT